MNENINLVEILRDAPKDTPLWSPVYGNGTLARVTDDEEYPIEVEFPDDLVTFTKEGFLYSTVNNAGCVLFPSREQQDWSKFVLSNKTFKTVTLHPFDRVLVRDGDTGRWNAGIFSYRHGRRTYVCAGSVYCQCIPYNADTAHLLGTTDPCPFNYNLQFSTEFEHE